MSSASAALGSVRRLTSEIICSTDPETDGVYRIDYDGAPTLDLTVNGSDGPIELAPDGPLSLALSFNAGTAGTVNPAEVYVGVLGPDGLTWLQAETGTWSQSATPVYTGTLSSFGPTTLLDVPSVPPLPSGLYSWIVIVDDHLNGQLDPHSAYWDIVQTTVP